MSAFSPLGDTSVREEGTRLSTIFLTGIRSTLPAIASTATMAGSTVVSSIGTGIRNETRSLSASVGQSVRELIVGSIRGALTAATAVAGTVIAASTASIIATVSRSQSVLQLSQASGLGTRGAANAVGNLGAFGINPGEVAGLSQNAFQQQMGSAVFGLGGAPGSAEWLRSYRQRYQGMASGGPMGLMMAQSMEGSLGTQGLRGVANLPSDMFERQMSRSQTMRGALGMRPEEIERAGQSWAMLNASVREFGTLVMTHIGSRLITRLEGLFDRLVTNTVNNVGGIGRAVDGAVDALIGFGRFIYADLPVYVTGGIDAILGAAQTIADGAPRIVDGAAEAVGKGIEYLSNAYVQVEGIFHRIADAAMVLVNSPLFQTLLRVGRTAATVGGAARDVASGAGASTPAADAVGAAAQIGTGALIWGGARAGARWLGRAVIGGGEVAAGGVAAGDVAAGGVAGRGVAGSLIANPIAQVIAGGLAVGGGLGYVWNRAMQKLGGNGYEDQGFLQHMATGWGRARDLITGNSGHYDREWYAQRDAEAARHAQVQRAADNFSAGARGTVNTYATRLSGFSGRVGSGITSARQDFQAWQRQNIGSLEDRRREYDALTDIAHASRQTAENTKRNEEKTMTAQQWMQMMRSVMALSASYSAQDAFLNLSRI
jgi:hypothetical protein